MKLSWLYIAWRNLAAKPLSTGLSIALLAFGVGMVSLMMLAEHQLRDAFDRNIKDIDMVLGAKGSPLQLILANVYHVDAPTGNINLAEAQNVMRHPYVAEAIPLAYGDNFQRYRIVGTEPSYLAHYEAELASGRMWDMPFEVVVGSRVAREAGLKLGDTFFSAHGLLDDTDVHTDKVFTVVGILAESRSVLDQLLLCNIQTVWGVHEHEEAANQEVTAVLLKKRNPLAVLTLPNVIADTNMQIALPAIEVNRLTQNFGLGLGTLQTIAWLIMALSFASIFISVYDSLLARRYELALMRTMGSTARGIYGSLLLEGGILSVGGVLLGAVISRLGIALLATVVEDKFRYDLGALAVLPDEWLLALAAVLVGLLAAAIPGIKALKLDISRTLADA